MECKTSSEVTQSYGNMVIGLALSVSARVPGPFRGSRKLSHLEAASFRETVSVPRKDVRGLPDISHAG
jgi:hypothetical protein